MTLPQWLSLAALIAAVSLIWSLRHVVLLLFAGIVIAMALCTLVGILRQRRPMPRASALLVCIGGLLTVVAMASAVVVPPFIDQFTLLLQKLPEAAGVVLEMGLGSLEDERARVWT